MRMRDFPLVSVIIPAFNDEARLELCLDALERQTYPRDRVDIIVVDNGSNPPLRKALQNRPELRVLLEPTPGSYAARNLGVAHARGEILAFTDSDCIPAERWLECAVDALLGRESLGAVAGRIEVFVKDPARPTAVELFDRAVAFRQDRNVADGGFGVTANLVVRRLAFMDAGPFDDTLLSGGDREWCQRMVSAGYEIAYAQDAVVAHPARRDPRDLVRKMRRVAGGHHLLAQRRSMRSRLLEVGQIVTPPFRMIGMILTSGDLDGLNQKIRAAAMAVLNKCAWSCYHVKYLWNGSRSGLPRA